MNIVLTGATGFVGSHVLTKLLAHPEVAAVTCLTRRSLAVTHQKLTTIVHRDFTVYDDALAARLALHDACIWAIGGKASEARTEVEYERTTHRTAIAFASAVAGGGPFRFCYLSGMGADPTESSRLPWERMTRYVKGRTEKDLAAVSERYPSFSTYSFRPGGILPEKGGLVEYVLAPLVVQIDTLAEAMIRVALHGAGKAMIGNEGIKQVARGVCVG